MMKNIIILNKTIEDNLDINELHLRNEIEKTEVKKIDYEIDSKSKILKGLETYEYNPECDKCMKNPKVIEMFNIKECIIRLNVQKEKIFIDETITNRKEEYEQNKLELNKYYKSKNDKSSYLKVLNKDNNRNDKEMVDIENKIKLLQITLRIEEEKNNAEIGPLKVKQECLKKGMEETMKNMNCKKGLENKMVELENDRILIIKNEEMRKSNEKCEEVIKGLNDTIKGLKMKLERYKEIIAEKDNMILLERLLEEIDEEKKNIEQNKIIKVKIDVLEIEIKNMNKSNLILEKEITKKEIENNNLEGIISKYKHTVCEIKAYEKEYKKWEYYNDVVDKNGIPLYIINKYLQIITIGINKIIGVIINKRIELYELSDNIIINIYDSEGNIVDFVGGMETFIIDISLKITLAKIMELSKCNFLFIDEGISSFDKDNLTHIDELFYFLNQHFDYIFLMSHIEQIKDYVSQKIMIKNEGGYSKVI